MRMILTYQEISYEGCRTLTTSPGPFCNPFSWQPVWPHPETVLGELTATAAAEDSAAAGGSCSQVDAGRHQRRCWRYAQTLLAHR